MADSKPTTRRDFVRLTSTALSIAVTGTAIAVPIDTDADAELMAVGKQLLALYEREVELLEILAQYREAFVERQNAIIMEETDKVRRRELEAELMLAMGPEFIAAYKEQGRIVEAMDEPERRMLASPAHTIHGVGLKALCAAYQNPELWNVPFNDLDREDSFFRALTEAVLAFAGYQLPFATPVMPAASLACAAREIDPIFVAIERHREAWGAFTGSTAIAFDLEAAVNRSVDADAGADARGDVVQDLKNALLETKPTTPAGTMAVIRYVNSYYREPTERRPVGYHELFEDDEYFTFLATIADTIEATMHAA
jgi:hypothetical protein